MTPVHGNSVGGHCFLLGGQVHHRRNGKDHAINLGLNYDLVMYGGLSIVSGITAVVVASVGRIPSWVDNSKHNCAP